MNEMTTTGGASMTMMPPQAANQVAMVFQTREMVEALAAIQMARMMPRDIAVVRQRLKEAAKNESLAVNAEYIYCKGGTEVKGLSIRAAEALGRAYGNLQVDMREVEVTDKMTTVQVSAWDLETNWRPTDVFQVPHSRSKGKWETDEYGRSRRVGTEVVPITDQRELDEITRSRGSRIKRACILAAIPVDIQEEFAADCERTLYAKIQKLVDAKAKNAEGGKTYTIRDMIGDMLGKLKTEYGVTSQMVCERFQRKNPDDLYNLDNRQVVMLFRILAGLKDGVATPADYFKGASTERVVTVGPTGEGASSAKDGLKNALKRDTSAKSAPTRAPGAADDKVIAPTGETPKNGENRAPGEMSVEDVI